MDEIIKLNVGGKRFETLRSTLLSLETYFTGLLDCDIPPSGEYFIDRDGKKFPAILNYLRGNRDEYIDPIEASFYALPLFPEVQYALKFHQQVQKGIHIFFLRNNFLILNSKIVLYLDSISRHIMLLY
jgi:hypothetical protein